MFIGAYGELAAKLFAVDNDGRFGCFARRHWLRVRVLDHGVKLPNVAPLHGSGSLLLGIAPAVFDLHEAGMRGNLPVKECLNLAVVAACVETLVRNHVGKECAVVSASAGASDASSGSGVEGGVFPVEWCIREGEIEVGLYPRGNVLCG